MLQTDRLLKKVFITIFFLFIFVFPFNAALSEENLDHYPEEGFELYQVDDFDIYQKETSLRIAYGTTVIVDANSPVPFNWIVLYVVGSQKTIKYVGGASYGAKEVASQYGDIPPNWIITQFDDLGDATRRHIKYLGGASYGKEERASSYGEIPSNWAILWVDTHYRYLKYLGNPPQFGLTERISRFGEIPEDWAIEYFHANGEYRQIICLAHAQLYQTVKVYLFGPLPAGWFIIHTSDRRRTIQYIGI
ncbi:MAG: hypothetical protein MI862_01090 [Desulfobacterales bacterium]|nr:hypothetical protein [Desulfobacterales bacterium]